VDDAFLVGCHLTTNGTGQLSTDARTALDVPHMVDVIRVQALHPLLLTPQEQQHVEHWLQSLLG